VNEACAEFLKERFVELLVAPDYEESAKQLLSKKKNLRVLQSPLKAATDREWVARSINGGILVQDEDFASGLEWQSVTKNPLPSTSSFKNLASFGVIVTQYLKSNCIGLFQEQKCNDGSMGYVILSSGVGQPNRLDCITKLIAPRLKERGLTAANALLVSDAFFPFRDSIDAAHTLGVTCILQPGGSVRDPEVIEACNEYGIQMGLTGKRHFRH
jgi:phosphoribosylaminoimidazolecarboxamide formyltransferase/IMP cyclohydrolase